MVFFCWVVFRLKAQVLQAQVARVVGWRVLRDGQVELRASRTSQDRAHHDHLSNEHSSPLEISQSIAIQLRGAFMRETTTTTTKSVFASQFLCILVVYILCLFVCNGYITLSE